jgi:MarR family transcriptional regulator, transcriptional regulator for hemolysin
MAEPAGPRPEIPIGLDLARTARTVTRAFDQALAEVGGSVAVWLVLISLKTRTVRNQRELAQAVGIREATLTHHLNSMGESGLVTRRRDPTNRRVHLVEITPDGDLTFFRLRETALAFDSRLRAGLGSDEIFSLGRVLARLRGNVAGQEGIRG